VHKRLNVVSKNITKYSKGKDMGILTLSGDNPIDSALAMRPIARKLPRRKRNRSDDVKSFASTSNSRRMPDWASNPKAKVYTAIICSRTVALSINGFLGLIKKNQMLKNRRRKYNIIMKITVSSYR
jgi:hypothetical protein